MDFNYILLTIVIALLIFLVLYKKPISKLIEKVSYFSFRRMHFSSDSVMFSTPVWEQGRKRAHLLLLSVISPAIPDVYLLKSSSKEFVFMCHKIFDK